MRRVLIISVSFGRFAQALFLIAIVLATSCRGHNNNGSNGHDMSANDSVVMHIPGPIYNFGAVKEGERITHDFLVENKGNYDLIIFEVNRTCGCTVVDFEKGPIAPGKSGKVTIRFNTTGRVGAVNKKVTIISNSQRGNPELVIQGTVMGRDK
jgi:hypothetical protein